MSASGQKRTLGGSTSYVRFAPQSGPRKACAPTSVPSYEQKWKRTTNRALKLRVVQRFRVQLTLGANRRLYVRFAPKRRAVTKSCIGLFLGACIDLGAILFNPPAQAAGPGSWMIKYQGNGDLVKVYGITRRDGVAYRLVGLLKVSGICGR